jgi:hypothetical protein
MSDPAGTLPGVEIRSTWIIERGEILTADGKRANKKYGPRKKSGPPMSDETAGIMQRKIEISRERRRMGLPSGGRDR